MSLVTLSAFTVQNRKGEPRNLSHNVDLYSLVGSGTVNENGWIDLSVVSFIKRLRI